MATALHRTIAHQMLSERVYSDALSYQPLNSQY